MTSKDYPTAWYGADKVRGAGDKSIHYPFSAKIFKRSGGETLMEYKGYSAKVEFDEGANSFHGEVINLRDVVTFEGETVDQLRQAFQESIDDYLEFCGERGEDPEIGHTGS